MDSTIITFQCWINGDDVEDIFTLDVSGTGTVLDLKKAIKRLSPNTFRNVTVDNFDLYSIPNPSDEELDAVLKPWEATGKEKLDAQTKLSTLASPGGDPEPFVVIVGPAGFGRREITLICYTCIKDFRCCFPVTVSSTDLVGTLKEAMRPKRLGFRKIPANALMLYKVCLPIGDRLEDIVQRLSLSEEDSLSSSKTLSYYFPEDPPLQHVHLIVELQTRSPVIRPRMQYIADWDRTAMSPKEQGMPSNFSELQSTDCRIEWNRSSVGALTIPVTLLHPIFGQFVDDCENHEPNSDDSDLALDLCYRLSNIFADDERRRREIDDILSSKDMRIYHYHYSRSNVEYGMEVDDRRYAILVVKNEINSWGAEPYCQAIVSYVTGSVDEVKKAAMDDIPFNFPCLVITLFGPHLSFSGAVWADRPNYQILTTGLPLFSPPNDKWMRESIGRHIGALRKACEALKELYKKFNADPATFGDLQPEFPHPRSYTSLDGNTKVHFRYLRVLEAGKLLFVVETDTGERLCAKFAHAYSVAVHQQCADWGISPPLRGYEVMPGGWRMIVMDRVDDHECLGNVKHGLSCEDKERLRRELESRLKDLHEMNYVHGDVRDSNVMVAKDRSGWKLIDFGWSGEIGRVRYPNPMNLTGVEVRRPEGATDGQLILARHDMEMLDYLF